VASHCIRPWAEAGSPFYKEGGRGERKARGGGLIVLARARFAKGQDFAC